MNKCDFCKYSRPNGIIKCGWTIFEPYFKSTCCERALEEMKKFLKKEKCDE